MMGVFGALRRDELVKMRFTDVRDVGGHIIVNIPVTKTDKGRSFIIIEEDEMCALELIRQYISLRPEGVSDDRFFLCQKGKRCTSQPVGKNTFGKVPCKIAQYLGLADATVYTGHCLRRTSATLHSDAGGSMTGLMQLGGWKSSTVARSYVDDSECSKRENARLVAGVETHTYAEVSIVEKVQTESQSMNVPKSMSRAGFSFSGDFQNCNFYIKE